MVIQNKIVSRSRGAGKGRELIVQISSGLFILLFLYAAANKILDFQKFKVQLGQSPILTDYAGIIAWLIPAIEIGIALLLVFPKTMLTGLYASFGLMVMFTAYIYISLNFTERVPCSCGGILEKMGWTEHLIFNIFFVILGLIAIIVQAKINKNKAPYDIHANGSGDAENL